MNTVADDLAREEVARGAFEDRFVPEDARAEVDVPVNSHITRQTTAEGVRLRVVEMPPGRDATLDHLSDRAAALRRELDDREDDSISYEEAR